jgi:glycolate oxidase
MLPEIKKEIYKRAISLGGTITAEHGIGYIRKDYLSMALSSDEIELSKRIKSAFDPNMILNPGKIF